MSILLPLNTTHPLIIVLSTFNKSFTESRRQSWGISPTQQAFLVSQPQYVQD